MRTSDKILIGGAVVAAAAAGVYVLNKRGFFNPIGQFVDTVANVPQEVVKTVQEVAKGASEGTQAFVNNAGDGFDKITKPAQDAWNDGDILRSATLYLDPSGNAERTYNDVAKVGGDIVNAIFAPFGIKF